MCYRIERWRSHAAFYLSCSVGHELQVQDGTIGTESDRRDLEAPVITILPSISHFELYLIVHPFHCAYEKSVHDSRITITDQYECGVREKEAFEESDLVMDGDDVDGGVDGDGDERRSARVAEGVASEVGVTLITLCAVGALSTALPMLQKIIDTKLE